MDNVQHRGAPVTVKNLSMKYGAFAALDNVSIDVAAGEFLALLGPSGSGKSTMLMTIGGFNIPTGGEISIGDEVVTKKAPHLRNLGIVFQKYALFPHMTINENVAYPLRRRRCAASEIQREVNLALEMVSLSQLGHRYPSELSGGQQQRVALARALVFHPPVLLMDEPLGALDRKLREQLQMEIKRLHRSLGTTIIFVTHDQEEALSMADRVAVMDAGKLHQIGSPPDLYERPDSSFVANFIGESNFVEVEILKIEGENAFIQVPGEEVTRVVRHCGLRRGISSGKLAIRPEYLRINDGEQGIAAVIEEVAFKGDSVTLLSSSKLGETKIKVSANAHRSRLGHGDQIMLSPDWNRCTLFPND